MRKNTYEYRLWLDRRNAKNLKRRTKKKNAKKKTNIKTGNYNSDGKKYIKYDSKTRVCTFTAPLEFSIVQNPVETIVFFNTIISFITDKKNFGKQLFIDISKIQLLSTDALMYLLALVNNLSGTFIHKFNIAGNAPSSPEIRKKLNESGFYDFVKYVGHESLTRNDDNVQIVSGEMYDTQIAKKITDFVIAKSGLERKNCQFLYEAIIELMNNTQKHAYNKNALLYPRWYCYVEYDSKEIITVTFMDTGVGIPATIRKKLAEKLAEKLDILKLTKENKYVISTLNGDFRTSTKLIHGGKGLPKIRGYCTKGTMTNLHIVTNKADVLVHKNSFDGKDLKVRLRGTLYNWQIDLKTLKGVL